MNRRRFLFGLGAFAAPAIIRPGLLMPIRAIAPDLTLVGDVSLFEAFGVGPMMVAIEVQERLRQMIIEARVQTILVDHIAAQT